MAVKIADTLKALSNTFPVAECVDIDVNINGATKRLQKAIDDGEIGGGESTWNGTREDWEALSTEEKGKYEVVYFTDDYDSSGIGGDSSWTGTKEEWEALSPTEKEKYEVVYFTDDYDSVIGERDSSWKGTLEEWEALSTEEKGKYEVVYFTNDYDDNRLIDDSNISNKTTYSSTKIENSLDKKANATDLTAHTSDTNIHVTTSDKTKWNKVDNKIDKTDIVDNLTSTDTNKPLSANQGKILKGEIDNKANDNEVIKKTDIKTTLDENSTNTDVCSGKAIFDAIKNNVSPGESYSTDEQLTGGKWIDGKPIYRRVIQVLVTDSDDLTEINIGKVVIDQVTTNVTKPAYLKRVDLSSFNIKQITRMYGNAIADNGNANIYCPCDYGLKPFCHIYYSVTSKSLVFRVGEQYVTSNTTWNVILEYTKQ